VYAAYQEAVTAMEANTNAVSFALLDYSNTYYYGQCSTWKSFMTNKLTLPAAIMYWSNMTASYYSENVKSTEHFSASYRCTDKTATQRFASALNSANVTSIKCDNHVWKVFKCNSVATFCVDCDTSAICSSGDTCANTDSTMFVSSCSSSCTNRNRGFYYALNIQYGISKNYPIVLPTNSSTTAVPLVTPARKTIGVSLNISKAGWVYCAAVSTTTTISSAAQVKQVGYSASSSTKGVVAVTIKNVIPDTAYSIYCYTESFLGDAMFLKDVLKTQTATQTLCCRSISFTTFNGRVTAGSFSSPIVFALVALPRVTSTVTISAATTVSSYTCKYSDPDIVSSLSIYPSTPFTFTSKSTSLSNSFVVSGTAGCYNVTVAMTSGDNYYSVNGIVKVRSSTVAPDPPILQSAQFSNDGRSLVMTFDSETDYGATVIGSKASTSQFYCSNLVSFIGSSSIYCLWSSNSVLTALLSSAPASLSSVVDVGQTVTLLTNVTKAKCPSGVKCVSFSQSVIITTTAPSSPVTPSVKMSSSSLIASCDNIVLDASATTGQASRNWKSTTWSVSSSDIADVSGVQTYLNDHYGNGATSGLVTIDNSYLTPGTYTIMLALTNFIGGSGQSAISITVSSSADLHKVSIAGSSSVSVYRWQQNSFFAIASSKGCGGGDSTSLAYTWSVYENLAYTTSYTNVAKDKRFFKFDSYTLNTASSYILKVSVGAGSGITSATVAVTLLTSGVVAAIRGGSVKTIGMTDTLSLDGSVSYDIDYPTGSLDYSWSCIEVSPSYGDSCSGFDSAVTDESALTMNATDLLTGITSTSASYSFTVVPSSGDYSDSASVTVIVLQNALPSIALTLSVASKFSVSSAVSVSGTITGKLKGFDAVWTSEDVTLASPLTMTPVSKSFANKGSFGFSLVIAANSLTAGLTYTFELLASYSNTSNSELTSTGTVSVLMNTPPLGGQISVSPTNGTAMSTQFTINTYHWSDDSADFPLTYVLSYTVQGTTTSTISKNRDTTPYVTTIMGQGLELYGYNVTISADAYDIYNDASSATYVVAVYPEVNMTAISIAAKAALAAAFQDGNPGAVGQAVGAAANSLNAVNCTVPKSCDSINRQACSTTANTCGSCLDGYIGQSGDSNAACISSSRRRRLSDGCSSDDDCLVGTCQDNACVDSTKSCPNDCSGQGECLHYDVYNVLTDSCLSSNAFCKAQCNCTADFYGVDCSLTEDEYLSKLEIRETLCANMYDAVSLQDLTSDAVLSRANLLAGMLLDLTQLSETAFENCVNVLVYTVETDAALVAQSTTASQVVAAFSSILAMGSSIPSDILTNVTYALELLSTGFQANMIAGQDFSSYSTSAIRISNGLAYSTDLSGMTISVPQTSLEEYVETPMTTFQVTPTSSDSNSFGVSIVQYNTNPHSNASSNAISAGLQLTQDSSATSDALVETILVLQNVKPVKYYFYAAFTNVTECYKKTPEASYMTTIPCNGGTSFDYSCTGKSDYLVNYTCPEMSKTPKCITYDDTSDSFIENPYCTVTSYTENSTTCSCSTSVPTSSSRRLSSGFPQTGITEFSAGAEQVADNFVATLNTVNALNPSTISKNVVIFSVTTGVVVALFIGLYWTIKEDLREIDAGIAHYKKDVDCVVGITADYTFEGFMEAVSPTELTKQPAIKKFIDRVVNYHDFIYAFSKFRPEGDFRTVTWLKAVGWTIMFLFMDTVLASLFFFDDGSCEKHATRSSCLLQTSLDQMDTLCLWDKSTETCSFNQDIGNSAVSNLIMTSLITIFSIPFEKLFEIMVDYVREFVVIRYLKDRKPRWKTPIDQLCLDLCSYESKKNTLLRAARLALMKQNIDEISTHEEAIRMCAEEVDIANYLVIPENYRGLLQEWEIMHSFNTKKQLSHHFNLEDRRDVAKTEQRLQQARKRCDVLVEDLNKCETDFDREVLLIRQFQSALLSSFRQYIAKRFYDAGNSRAESLKKAKIGFAHYFSLFMLPCYIVFTCFFVFLFGVRMGPATTNAWLKGGIIAFCLELLFFRPIKILVRRMFLSQVIFPDIRIIHQHLVDRARLVMARTNGLIRTHNANIQHFNAACRAARQFPHLQVARLLMSLNDHDFPSLLTSRPVTWKNIIIVTIKQYLEYTFLGMLLLLTAAPEDAQDVMFDFLGNMSACVIIVLLALSSTVHIAIPISIGGTLFLILFSSYAYMRWQMHTRTKEVNEKHRLSMAALSESADSMNKLPLYSFNKKQRRWRTFIAGKLGVGSPGRARSEDSSRSSSESKKRLDVRVVPINENALLSSPSNRQVLAKSRTKKRNAGANDQFYERTGIRSVFTFASFYFGNSNTNEEEFDDVIDDGFDAGEYAVDLTGPQLSPADFSNYRANTNESNITGGRLVVARLLDTGLDMSTSDDVVPSAPPQLDGPGVKYEIGRIDDAGQAPSDVVTSQAAGEQSQRQGQPADEYDLQAALLGSGVGSSTSSDSIYGPSGILLGAMASEDVNDGHELQIMQPNLTTEIRLPTIETSGSRAGSSSSSQRPAGNALSMFGFSAKRTMKDYEAADSNAGESIALYENRSNHGEEGFEGLSLPTPVQLPSLSGRMSPAAGGAGVQGPGSPASAAVAAAASASAAAAAALASMTSWRPPASGVEEDRSSPSSKGNSVSSKGLPSGSSKGV
jgi:hypothetical protein